VKIVTFKVPERLLARLDELALREGVTRSDILRAAIKLYIREVEEASKRKKPRIRVKHIILW